MCHQPPKPPQPSDSQQPDDDRFRWFSMHRTDSPSRKFEDWERRVAIDLQTRIVLVPVTLLFDAFGPVRSAAVLVGQPPVSIFSEGGFWVDGEWIERVCQQATQPHVILLARNARQIREDVLANPS